MPVEGAAVAEQQKVTPTQETGINQPSSAPETTNKPDKAREANRFGSWLKGRLEAQKNATKALLKGKPIEAIKSVMPGGNEAVSPGQQAALEGAATAAAADTAGVGSLEQIAEQANNKPPTKREVLKGARAAVENPLLADMMADPNKGGAKNTLRRILHPVRTSKLLNFVDARRLKKSNPLNAHYTNTSKETPGQGPGPSSTK
jgi:hypothetical protein